jgi:hypothetical protein
MMKLTRGIIMSVQLNTIMQLPEKMWKNLSQNTQRYVNLLWKRDAGAFVGLESYSFKDKNWLEIAGDTMLYPMVGLPHRLAIQNKYVAVALASSGLTMFALKFFANPFATTSLVGRTIAFLPRLPAFLAKFSLFAFVCRSLGRMFSYNLMEHFYVPKKS